MGVARRVPEPADPARDFLRQCARLELDREERARLVSTAASVRHWRAVLVAAEDHGLSPLVSHAQATPIASMSCQVDVQNEIFSEGAHDATNPLDFTSDSTDIDDIQAALDPGVAGQNIHLDIVPFGAGNDATGGWACRE